MKTVNLHSGDCGYLCVTAPWRDEIGAADVVRAVVVVRNYHVCGSEISFRRDSVCNRCGRVE